MMAPVRTWAKSLALSLSLAVLSAVPARAEADIVFGPSPRALDNQTLFGADTVPVWRNLHEAGVQEILLNGTFLMKSELRFGRNENGPIFPAQRRLTCGRPILMPWPGCSAILAFRSVTRRGPACLVMRAGRVSRPRNGVGMRLGKSSTNPCSACPTPGFLSLR